LESDLDLLELPRGRKNPVSTYKSEIGLRADQKIDLTAG
jgi:hypothetical protein